MKFKDFVLLLRAKKEVLAKACSFPTLDRAFLKWNLQVLLSKNELASFYFYREAIR
jgi:hypothetical protein